MMVIPAKFYSRINGNTLASDGFNKSRKRNYYTLPALYLRSPEKIVPSFAYYHL